MEQNLKARAARAKKQAADSSPKDVTALLRSADVLIHVLLSSVLSGAVVLGQSAPLGVAMAGASGSGLCGAAALSGACFGYMTLLGFSDGLRYAAAAILPEGNVGIGVRPHVCRCRPLAMGEFFQARMRYVGSCRSEARRSCHGQP